VRMRNGRDLRAAAERLPGEQGVTGMIVDDGWQEVCRYARAHEDGGEVIVSVHRLPAMFWQISCKEKGITAWSTGTGMEDLVHSMATAVAEGMLGGER
jgi:hypothetical protein